MSKLPTNLVQGKTSLPGDCPSFRAGIQSFSTKMEASSFFDAGIGRVVLQEAASLLATMHFRPGCADYAQGEFVAILIDPLLEKGGTMTAQINCWARGHRTVDWPRLTLWVKWWREGVEDLCVAPPLDYRGRCCVRHLPPTECSICVGSRGETVIAYPGPLGRPRRKAASMAQCAAAAAAGPAPPPPETLHICNSFDGMIAATVRAVGKGAEVAFETREPDLAMRTICFELTTSRTRRTVLAEQVQLRPIAGAPSGWEGIWRGEVRCKEPCRLTFQAGPAGAELNPPMPSLLPLASSVATALQVSSLRSETQTDLVRSCSDFRTFDGIIADPPFKTLADLKAAWQRDLTGAEVRHAWDNRLAKQPWSLDHTEMASDMAADQGLYAQTLRYRRLWYHMVHPDIRGFFHACRGTLASGCHRAAAILDEWLDDASSPLGPILDFGGPRRKGQLGPVLRAHLFCVRAALDNGCRTDSGNPCDSDCSAIQQKTRLPFGLIRDLAAELTGCAARSVAHAGSVAALLMNQRTRRGLAVDVVGESVLPGTGEIYPAPATALVFRDPKYVAGEEWARRYVADQLLLHHSATDVRWRLKNRGHPLPCEITGDSSSAAWGLLLAWLLAQMAQERTVQEEALRGDILASLRRLASLAGVAISGRLGPGGRLRMVSREQEKMLGARLDNSLPRIHTTIFPRDRRLEAAGEPAGRFLGNPYSDCRVLLAETLGDAAKKLAVDAETRWGPIPNYAPVLRRHDPLVGRVELKRRLRSFIEQSDRGYLLLVAAPGCGKTALMAEMVRHQLYPTASHFMERGQGDWDRPDVMLASIGAQIRRLFLLPALAEEQDKTPGGAFLAVLNRASASLGPGQKAVVLVDGLDEAFGAGGRFARIPLSSAFPRALPTGIKVVLTSRAGKHLDWLADPMICDRVVLPALDQSNVNDIEEYLWWQSRARNLAMSPGLIRQLVLASQGCFAAAVLCLRERPTLRADLRAWEDDPSKIPHGLDDWLQAEWTRLLNPLLPGEQDWGSDVDGQRHTPPSRAIASILELIAAAQEPLSHDHLATFLSHLVRQEAHYSANTIVGAASARELLEHLDSVWALTEDLMEPQEGPPGATTRHQFFHSRFREFILSKLSQAERRDGHKLLARACDGWRRYQGAVRDYALRHRFCHWAEAGRWKLAARAFADAGFVQERSRRFGFSVVHDDARIATLLPHMPRAWRQAFAQWELFLRPRIERLQQVPSGYAQEVLNEFLPTAAEPLCRALGGLSDRGSEQFSLRLHKVLGPPALIVAGHSAPVSRIALSPDGLRLVSAGQDGAVKVWDTATGRLVADCQGYQDLATGVAFSPGGEVVASASADGKVKLYEALTGRLLAICLGHKSLVTTLAFSPEGGYLASASNDGTVKVWDAHTGRLVADCVGHRERVNCIAFCPDPKGHLLASASCDGTAKVWKMRSGQLQADCAGHGDWVTAVCFSPDGRWLVSTGKDGTVKVWEVASGRLQSDCIGHHGWVLGICFSPNGRYAASAGADHTVKVWQARTGRLLADCIGHLDEVDGVAFSPDSRYLASGSGDRTVKIWEARTGRLAADCAGHRDRVSCVAFSSDRKQAIVASGSWDNTVKTWAAATGQLQVDFLAYPCQSVTIALSPDGQHAAVLGHDGAISIVETATRRAVADRLHHPEAVTGFVFSADGRSLASGSKDGTVRVWEAATGRVVADCATHEGKVTGLAFSFDGRLIASAGIDKTVRISETTTGRPVANCLGHEMTVASVVFAPDARYVASASNDRTVKIFEASTGRLLASCHGHQEGVRYVTFSPDGQYLVSAGWDAALKVWEAETGRLKAECSGHGAWINHAVFSPNGRYLASCSHDASVKLWMPETGRLYAACHGHQADVNWIGFSSDGRYLASASADKTVRLWRLDEPTLPDACCANVLFFQYEPIAVAFLPGEPNRLLVGDRTGRIFGYEMREP